MSPHTCEKDVMKLKYEWPLDEFLKLRQIIEIREALETARNKDYEIEMAQKTK